MRSLGECTKPDDFMTGVLNPEDSGVLSYSFVKALMTNTARYNSMLAAVRAGVPFAQAFGKAFGNSPDQLAMGWVSRAGSKKGR